MKTRTNRYLSVLALLATLLFAIASPTSERQEFSTSTTAKITDKQHPVRPDIEHKIQLGPQSGESFLRARLFGELSEQEEHRLKLLDYHSYLRHLTWQNTGMAPRTLRSESDRKELFREKIAAPLLEQLKKNREVETEQ